MTNEELSKLIDEYGTKKAEFEALKKNTDSIKAGIEATGNNTFETELFKATRYITVSADVDENAWLRVLKEHGYTAPIKTKEYIDTDELEKLIYDGQIPSDVLLELDKYKTVKQSVGLKLTRKKN